MSDTWHPVRFAVALLVFLALLGLFLVGLLALPFLLRMAGYRGRDTLLFLIPVYQWVLLTIVLWRVTATSVYWSQRPDLRSRTLIGARQPDYGRSV